MATTLEQRRAADAWKCAQGQSDAYVNLAKGLPALIMNSGLMQVMAYLHEKGGKETQAYYRTLAGQLRSWLHGQFKTNKDFEGFMNDLMQADSLRFQAITAEAFAWLRWVRQVSAAVIKS